MRNLEAPVAEFVDQDSGLSAVAAPDKSSGARPSTTEDAAGACEGDEDFEDFEEFVDI